MTDTITFRIDSATKRRLVALARDRGISVSALIVELIERELEDEL